MGESLPPRLRYTDGTGKVIEPMHELDCDQNHTPRQRCNHAAPAAAERAGDMVVPEPLAPVLAEPSAIDELEPVVMTLQRDAIAAIEIAAPTRFVAEEWDKTAAAVLAANRRAPAPASRVRPPSPLPSPRTSAMVAVTLLILAVVALRRR